MYIYSTYIVPGTRYDIPGYMNTTMNKTFVAYVVGTQVEIQYTAVRVHVPGKYYIVHCNNSNSSNSAIASC